LQHEGRELDLIGHRILGQTLVLLGELRDARGHLEEGLRHYRSQSHNPITYLWLQEPGVSVLCDLALLLYLLGYPDQALHKGREALTLANEWDHPYSQAYALDRLVMVHSFRREIAAGGDYTAAGLALATEHDFTYWKAINTMWQGWWFGCEGRMTEGMARIRQGLDTCRSIGVEITRPYELGKLAPMCASSGHAEEGLTILGDALALVDQTEERWYEAELYRLRGTLLLSLTRKDRGEAEVCFRQALSIARQQQAKSLELRAATSLAQLWQSQDKRQDACDLLAPVYNWFTEGFDTADLQDAKRLLDELNAEMKSPTA
jgi:predicted ATPase